MKIRVHILATGTGHEAYAIRLAAEAWGAEVSATWVGNGSDVVDYFSSSPGHDLVIVSAHGDERGILLPTLHPDIQHLYPYNDVIGPDDFPKFTKLAGVTVVSLACLSGTPAFGNALLGCGARAYIGPVGYPSASAALMFALTFIYEFIRSDGDIPLAHSTASRADDDRGLFELFTASP